MSVDDTWILVSVPRTAHAPIDRRAAARIGLALLAWADRRRPEHAARSVELDRVARAIRLARPFC
jgi:hypothetical protein